MQVMQVMLFLIISVFVSGQVLAAAGDPGTPAIERPVHLTDQGQYERPYVPVFRSTRDGRLSYNVKGGNASLYLNTPEKITDNYHASPDGPTIIATSTPFIVPRSQFIATTFGGENGHNAICEMPDDQGNQRNPYACGEDDCYDIVHITLASGNAAQTFQVLQGTPATVRVRNPKTPGARIVDVDLGETVVSPHRLPTSGSMFEPMVTADGHLLVGRVANDRFTWRNARTNRNVTGTYDMVYLAAPDNPARACDVTQWDEIKPLGHAPYDPEINTRYGFAMQLFRDAIGNVIPDNTDIGGSYPWIDAKGNNISFAPFGTALDFPAECVPNRGCESIPSFNSTLMGKTIVGLWTQGKMIMMDSLVNNIDYGAPRQEDSGHRLLDMYAAGTGPNSNSTGKVRVGGGRDNSGTAGLAANPTNTSFQESIENKLNFWKNMRPSTPDDVVWHFSTGAGSDELSFDDYLYENSFIVSSMVQASNNNGRAATQFSGIGNAATRVQNGAASEHWSVPAFGNVVNTRIERVALGGIHGKGLWHTATSRIDYTVGSQPRNIRNNDWQISLFVDARFANNNAVRALISFPDGSELQLVGRDQVRYWDNGSVLRTINLPSAIPENGWAHVGVQMTNRNRTATLYLNGFAVDTYQSNENFFELSAGRLSVGDSSARSILGFRGWVDDFKVIAHRTNPEGWCAQANGQLVGSDSANNQLSQIARSYPNSSHQAISDLLASNDQDTYSFYACYVDYSGDYLARADTIPAGFSSIRESINFPEGPLVHNEPRPDSLDNQFCLQCHTADAPKGLGLPALALDLSLTAVNDPRRQPMQPPARVFGNIPANWLGQGLPARRLVAPAQGFPIDEALLPSDNPSPLWEEVEENVTVTDGQTLRHVSTGMKLSGGAQLNGAIRDVDLVNINANNADDQWQLVDAGNGYVHIDNTSGDLRLRDAGENAALGYNDIDIVPNSWAGAHTQWLIEPTGDNSLFITNRASGQKLHTSVAQGRIPNAVNPRFTGDNVRWQLVD